MLLLWNLLDASRISLHQHHHHRRHCHHMAPSINASNLNHMVSHPPPCEANGEGDEPLIKIWFFWGFFFHWKGACQHVAVSFNRKWKCNLIEFMDEIHKYGNTTCISYDTIRWNETSRTETNLFRCFRFASLSHFVSNGNLTCPGNLSGNVRETRSGMGTVCVCVSRWC